MWAGTILRHSPAQSEVLLRAKIAAVFQIDMTADAVVSALLHIAETEPVCLLDSCGAGYLNSHLLIAGIEPVSTVEMSSEVEWTLALLDDAASDDQTAAIFTLSY